MKLSILYRGPLESCNFGCDYCPFAKKVESNEALAGDRASLERFLDWIRARPATDRLSIFFTPWGEALVRHWYRDALVELSHLPSITKAAVQTNLSMSIDFIDRAVPEKIGIWATYHPEWADRRRFVEKVIELHRRGVRVSAGVVGFRRFADEIRRIRDELPSAIYLWINAPKRYERLEEHEVRRFEAIDPHFRTNTIAHESLGARCFGGESVIAVDGDGTMRRCHFIESPIGNLYDPDFARALMPRACTNDTCGCHIGYVHLEKLGLYGIYGEGVLERVPSRHPPIASISTA
jgi:sulfatase maturation enzyme AslB (radical SAM superfamily)